MEIEAKRTDATWNPDSLKNCPNWNDLGVDFSPYPQRWLIDRIRGLGQIRVLHAIMATLGARPVVKDDSKQIRSNKLNHVARAIETPYVSPNAKRLLANWGQRGPDRFPVPWFGRYCKDATADEVDVLEQLTAAIFRGDHSVAQRLFVSNGPAYLSLYDTQLIVPMIEIVPDLNPQTVVIWLDFLVNGHNDPTLRPAFERYRPDRLKDHGAFVAAYEQLFGADSTKSISH